MADGFEIARAYVTLVPSMQGSQKTVATEMGAVTEPAATEAGEKSGKNFGNALAKGLKTTAAVIGGALTAATGAAVATGKAFVDSANDVAEYGNQIDKASQKLGMSSQAYQEWSYITERSGTSLDSLKKGFMNISGAMEQLSNASDPTKLTGAASAIDGLGISVTDATGAMKSKEQIFSETIAALQGIGDETERTVKAQEIFGKGAMELSPLLNQSAEETEALRQKVNDLGGIMSDDAVKASANYKDMMQDMDTAMAGVKNNMMAQFLPGLGQVMSGISKVFSGQEGGIGEIKEGLNSVITNINNMAPQLFELAGAIVSGLLEGFAPMLPQLVSSIFSFLTQGLIMIANMIPQLLPVITSGLQSVASALMTCLPVLIDGLISVVTELVTWLTSGDNVKTFVDGIISLATSLAMKFADLLPVLLPAIINIIGQISESLTDPDNVEMFVSSVLYTVGAVIAALVKALPEIGGLIVKTALKIDESIKRWGGELKTKVGTFISGLWDKISKWFTELPGKITTKLADIWSSIGKWFTELPGNISSAFTSALNTIKTLGGQLISGLWEGLKDKTKWLTDKVKNLGKSITDAVKGVFGIHSPSRVFADIGVNLALGLDAGWEDGIGDVKSDIASELGDFVGDAAAIVSRNDTPTALAASGNVYNGGAVTINVYGAEGQNINELAQQIAYKLEAMTARKGAVYA